MYRNGLSSNTATAATVNNVPIGQTIDTLANISGLMSADDSRQTMSILKLVSGVTLIIVGVISCYRGIKALQHPHGEDDEQARTYYIAPSPRTIASRTPTKTGIGTKTAQQHAATAEEESLEQLVFADVRSDGDTVVRKRVAPAVVADDDTIGNKLSKFH